MMETVESVKEYGVLVPIIARPMPDGGYEIVSGHRRKRACELAGLNEIPAIVRDLDDDEAVIIMVDSNLQRENILPSERAKAYQMKLEAIKHQRASGVTVTCPQIGDKLPDGAKARDIVAQEAGESKSQIQRIIRLNQLEKPLIDKVDAGKLAFTPAVELSYLKPEEQQWLDTALENTQQTPSLSQAQRMKRESKQAHAVGTGHHGNHDGEQADGSCQGVCRAAAGKVDQVFSTLLHDGADGKGNFQAAGLLDAETANVAGAIKTHETKSGYSADGHVSVRKHDFSLPNFRADKGGRRR